MISFLKERLKDLNIIQLLKFVEEFYIVVLRLYGFTALRLYGHYTSYCLDALTP